VEIKTGVVVVCLTARPVRAAEFVTEGARFATLKESLTKPNRQSRFVDGVEGALLDSAAKLPLLKKRQRPRNLRRQRLMQEDDIQTRPLHENLDTAYVNLAALLRYLRARAFVGRVHVELEEYEADVFLEGESTPRVLEINHAAGRESEGEAALQRLLVRASDPGGQISIYTNADEEPATTDEAPAHSRTGVTTESAPEDGGEIEPQVLGWPDLVRLSGDLIAAIERATLSFGADFAAMFHAARLELADDFSFLDPASQHFHYAHGVVRLQAQPNVNAYISSISETLRRVVDKLATAERGGIVRERVALELAVLARRRETVMRHFKLMPYLDRIAGTQVL